MTRLPIILALLLPACAGDLNTWRLGDGFAGTTREDAFRAATAQWCQAAELCAEIGDDGANTVETADDMRDEYLGYYEPDADGATIYVQPWLSGDDLARVLLHELGHHWGCDDNNDPDSVMYFSDGGNATRLAPSDIECAR